MEEVKAVGEVKIEISNQGFIEGLRKWAADTESDELDNKSDE